MGYDDIKIGARWTRIYWRKNKKAVRTFFSSLFVALLLIAASVSANAATEHGAYITNTAKVAQSLSIDLIEPTWDANQGEKTSGTTEESAGTSADNGAENNQISEAIPAKYIEPFVPIAKDPQAINKSAIDAWIFISVSIPLANVRISNGSDYDDYSRKELFSFNPDNNNWELVSKEQNDSEANYVYAYKRIVKPTEITNPLFQQIELTDFVDGDLLGERIHDVIVRAHGIQALGFETAKQAWQAYTNQSEMTL